MASRIPIFRLLSVAALMATLFLNSAYSALAQTSTAFVLLPSSTTVAPGATFTVDVEVETGGEEIVVAELHLDFDPAVLQVMNVTVPVGMPLPTSFTGAPAYDNDGPNNDSATGTVDYMAAKLGSPFPTTDFVFLTIEFQVKADAALGDTSITFFEAAPRKTRITSPAGDTMDAAAPLTISVVQPNTPPTADAGADQTVTDSDNNGSESVILDGSGSSDSDGTIDSYVWSEGATELGSGATLNYDFAVGTHTVVLTVTDDDGDSDSDEVIIVVNEAPNTPPTAVAGADQTVTDGDNNDSELVTLDGSGSSDSDGTIASYVWSEGATELGSGVTLDHNFAVGTHTVTLTVTDNDNAADTDEVVITINSPVNIAPIADAGADQTVTDSDNNGSQTVTLDGSGSSDGDGTIASYVWSEAGTQLGTGATLNYDFAVGTHTVLLTVTDDDGATGTDTVVITVEAAAPVAGTVDLVIVPANTQTYIGATFTVAVEVQAGSEAINGAEVHLTFDPALLAVQSFVKGSALTTDIVVPTYDNNAGTFSYATGKLGAPFPSGTFNLISITFQAKAASAGTSLTLLNTAPTKSNVTSGAGMSVLDQLVNSTVVISEFASVQGTVELQGRPAKPNAAWVLPLTVALYAEGETTPAYTFAPTTDNNGQFMVNGITPGTYTAAIKGATTLQVVEQVTLVTGPNAVNFGLLLAGNADNNNQIDLVDFSILSLTYNKSSGQTGYDGRADFNGNGAVTLEDFALLATNFNTAGEEVSGITSAEANEVEASAGIVQMRLLPSSSQAAVGEEVTLEVVMDAADQPVSGAEVHLDFDPSLLKVISANPGEHYATTLIAPRFNNDDGTVDYAAGRLEGAAPSGEIVLLSVRFAVVGEGEATVSFGSTFPRQSQAAYGGDSLLGTAAPAQISIGTEVTGEDPAAPRFTQHIFLPALSGE